MNCVNGWMDGWVGEEELGVSLMAITEMFSSCFGCSLFTVDSL